MLERSKIFTQRKKTRNNTRHFLPYLLLSTIKNEKGKEENASRRVFTSVFVSIDIPSNFANGLLCY